MECMTRFPAPAIFTKSMVTYTIKLLADFGEPADSISKNIEIYPVPQPDFSVQSVLPGFTGAGN